MKLKKIKVKNSFRKPFYQDSNKNLQGQSFFKYPHKYSAIYIENWKHGRANGIFIRIDHE